MGKEFQFKYFNISQDRSLLKVGTDSMLLGALASANAPQKGLDLGAGTGVLSLMLAQKYPDLRIDAIEMDGPSCIDCSDNFSNSKWASRLHCIHADYYEQSLKQGYDLIFSNPPFYLERADQIRAENEQSKHTDENKLFELFKRVYYLLAHQGVFWTVLPYAHYDRVLSYCKDIGLHVNDCFVIDAKSSKPKSRVVLSISHNTEPIKTHHLVLRNEDNTYTEAYIKLTKEFHFKQLKK